MRTRANVEITNSSAEDYAFRLCALFNTIESQIRMLANDIDPDRAMANRLSDLALLAEIGPLLVDAMSALGEPE